MREVKDVLQHAVLSLYTYSPVFVGCGHSLSKKEYIFAPGEKKVYVPDMAKMCAFLAGRGLLDSYESYLLQENYDFSDWLRRNGVSRRDYLPWIAYTVDSGNAVFEDRGKKEILTFQKDAYGCPYVPGSSLKGALRTALLGAELMRDPARCARLKQKVQQADLRSGGRTRKLAQEAREMEQTVFNRLHCDDRKPGNAVNDVLRGLRIGDSAPLKTQDLVLCQKVDVTVDGQQNKLNILRECIRPGVELRFDLTIAGDLCPYTPEMILKALADYGRRYDQCFRAAFGGEAEEPPVVYLGGGCGYAAKTEAYPLLGKEGVRRVSEIINCTLGGKALRQHGHDQDVRKGASPHMMKCTIYDGYLYEMGVCGVEIR